MKSSATRTLIILATISLMFVATCAGGQKWTNSFINCEKADFGKMVTVGTASEDVLRAVEDLILKNPADLELELAGLAVQATQITVNCAITATEDLLASLIGNGSGSAAGSAGSASAGSAQPLSQLRARARVQYPGLQRALAYAAANPAK